MNEPIIEEEPLGKQPNPSSSPIVHPSPVKLEVKE